MIKVHSEVIGAYVVDVISFFDPEDDDRTKFYAEVISTETSCEVHETETYIAQETALAEAVGFLRGGAWNCWHEGPVG